MLPTGILGANGTRYTFNYDEDHKRLRETRTSSKGTRVTYNLHPDAANGLSFEQEIAENGTISNRHYISAGGMSIAVAVTTSLHTATPAAAIATINVVQYWHKGNLGSTVATTNAAGVVLGRYSYDPFGKRRDITGKYDPWGNLVIDWGESGANAGPDRGFTGHEHLDDVGIIHMNGRLYDPLIGRMMQADSYIQAMADMQNFNRFTYAMNNPLRYTDPSGNIFGIDDIIIYAFVALVTARATGIIDQQTFRMGLAILAGTLLGPGGALAFENAALAAATAGFAAGAISTGTWEGAFMGMASGMLFYGAGVVSGQGYLNLAPDSFGRVLVHAGAGCINARLSGGSCATGAATAGFTKAAGMYSGDAGGRELNTFKYAIIGGTASVIGGGKFANGAVTGAFQYLFNAEGEKAREERMRRLQGPGLNALRPYWEAIFGQDRPPASSIALIAAGGVEGSVFVAVVGTSLAVSPITFDTYGNSCFSGQACVQLGLGGFIGGGLSGQLGVGNPLTSGKSDGFGAFYNSGAAGAAGGSVMFSSGGVDGARGFAGVGTGASGGVQLCQSYYSCTKKD
jgi:RHS repeat-associated protein